MTKTETLQAKINELNATWAADVADFQAKMHMTREEFAATNYLADVPAGSMMLNPERALNIMFADHQARYNSYQLVKLNKVMDARLKKLRDQLKAAAASA